MNVRVWAWMGLVGACVSTADVDPEIDPGRPIEGLVTIEMVPLDTVETGDWLNLASDPNGQGAQSEAWLPLAWGVGYPSEITINQGEIWESRCLWEGTWTPRDVSSADPTLLEATLKNGELNVQVLGVGTTKLSVSGSFKGGCPWHDDLSQTQELERVIEVVVAEPDGAVLTQPWICDSALVVADGRLEEGFAVLPTVGGEPFDPRNARSGRQVSVTLDLPDGVSATLPSADQSFGEMQILTGTGSIAVSTPQGPVDSIEVISPAEVTDLDLGWAVPHGDYNLRLLLEDGERYAWSDIYNPDQRQVVVSTGALHAGDRTTCSAASPDWFDVQVDPNEGEIADDWVKGGRGAWIIGRGAILGSAGQVQLTANAPDLAGGAGLSSSISVTFTE